MGLALVSVCLGFGCSMVVCVWARQGAKRRIATFATGSLSVLAAAFAAAALLKAATLSKYSSQFKGIAAQPGAGSICMALLALVAFMAAVLEIMSRPVAKEESANLGG